MIGVAIGGSAGSLDALHGLFGALGVRRASFVVVLHISPTSRSLLASVIGGYTRLPVVEAVDKMPLEAGTVVVGPPDYHVLIERDRRISLSRDPAVHFSRPAIDPLFETVADTFGARAIGVLLSGSNADGAEGLRAIERVRGRTLIQDPASATSPEMPSAGLRACTPTFVGVPAALGRWLAVELGETNDR